MAFSFPTSPTLNQEYTFGNKTWRYNGTGWILVTGVDAAQSAWSTANLAYIQANTATNIGQGAYDNSNTKFDKSGGTISGNVTIQYDLSVLGNVNFVGNVTSITVSGNSGQFFGYASNGHNALYAGIPVGYDYQPQTVFQASANYDGYSQINIQNINGGPDASGDYVATADNGTENDTYIDMGIASSTHADPEFTLIGPNDGYLYTHGNTTTSGGDLVLGTFLPENDVVFAAGGMNEENEQMRIIGSSNTINIRANVDASLSKSVLLGAVANVHITGGSNDDYIRTDGAGNLTFTPLTSANVIKVLYNTANAAFASANNIDGVNLTQNTNILSAASYANSAFVHANSGFIHANSAFVHANSAYQSQNATGQYANSAFVHANSAYESQNATGQYANAAFIHANSAYQSQNATGQYANSAFIHANSAYESQNATGQYANAAFIQANTGYNLANSIANNSVVAGTANVANYVRVESKAGSRSYNVALLDATTGNLIIGANTGLTYHPGLQTVFAQLGSFGQSVTTTSLLAASFITTVFNTTATTIRMGGAATTVNIGNAGGTTNVFGTLAVNGVSVIGFTQGAYNTGNSAFIQANASFDHANAAFAAANNVFPQIQPSYDTANAAFIQANGAIVHAQSAFNAQNTTGQYANAAFAHANAAFESANNVAPQVQPAFNTANAAFIHANSAYADLNTVSIYANTPSHVANSAAIYANGAFAQANIANNNANSASVYANASFVVANSGFIQANSAFFHANAAFNTGNASFAAANSGGIYANGAFATANSGSQYANSAFVHANSAHNTSNSAFIHANSAFSKANDAYSLAESAYNLAVNFDTLALDIIDIQGVDVTQNNSINAAFLQANTPSHVANSAAIYANGAFVLANGTAISANTPSHVANSASSYANAAFIRANNSLNANVGGTITGNVVVLGNTITTNLEVTNQTTLKGNFIVDNGIGSGGGSEGGEIRLVTPSANTNLTAGTISVDIYQDKLRFFETGGSNRGAFINLAAASAGVGTDLLAGGGGGGTLDQYARNTANAAFDKANIADVNALSAGSYANSAFIHSNSSFIRVNSAYSDINTISIYANTPSHVANSAAIAANTPSHVANSAAIYANGAFGTANSAAIAANTPSHVANSAAIYANGAFGTANSAAIAANTPSHVANSASIYANGAFETANSAAIAANTPSHVANSAAIAANTPSHVANSAASYANAAFTRANNSVDANNGGIITGDLTITKNLFVGNVFVTGNTFSLNVGTIVANDTVIVLGAGNYLSDTLDIGIAGHYNDGTNAHAGLIRDSITKEWYLFKGYTPEVGANNNVDINDPSFKIDTLNANLHSTYVLAKGIDLLPRTNIIFDLANSAAIAANTPSHVANSASIYANGAFTRANNSLSTNNGGTVTANVIINANLQVANVTTNTYIQFGDGTRQYTANAGSGGGSQTTDVQSWIQLADGTNSTYTMTFTANANAGVIVSIGGIVQSEGYDYLLTPSNSTISFNEPPPGGERIRVAGYSNIIPSFIDSANSAGATINTFEGVGNGSTQTFNLGFDPISGKAIFVSLGGVLQPESAYTVDPANNTIYFFEAPAVSENVRVVGYSRVNPFYLASSNVSVSVFETTANGSQSTFQLAFNPQARETLIVTIDGILQPTAAYSVNTTTYTITFDEAPAAGEFVRVATLYTTANPYVVPDGTITIAKFAPDANALFQAAFDAANVANAAASTGKAIAMSIVFGG